ncbi:MAG: hypothetical protein K2O12_01090, partial [Muribaculaceae bacterium]|nr:hypothetical protein [Muribaculaceae bacterium]
MLTTDDICWINSHINDDIASLRLKHHGSQHMAHLINQIACRRKAASKLAMTLRCHAFEFPTELSQEQATSDRLAEFHASLVPEGGTCADLTSGLGIDILHIAQRCSTAVAIEREDAIANILRDNAAVLSIHNLTVITGDCRDILPKLDRFDTIFIDPARRSKTGGRIFALSDCHPDVVEMLPEIKRHTDCLIIKMSPMLDISAISRTIGHCCTQIIALGDRRECKELIAICRFDTNVEAPEIKSVTLFPDGHENTFVHTKEQEAQSSARYADAEAGKYIIDPYPAIMKTAPWRSLCTVCNAGMIADNTHLYIADSPKPDFGESYLINEIIPYASREIKRLSSRYPSLSVAARNFPLRAEDL